MKGLRREALFLGFSGGLCDRVVELLRLRMSQKRFARSTNRFSKKFTHRAAAVSLCVIHYEPCRLHEALRTTSGRGSGCR